jgi:hypothetical protein
MAHPPTASIELVETHRFLADRRVQAHRHDDKAKRQ